MRDGLAVEERPYPFNIMNTVEETSRRILLALSLDAEQLYGRIKYRRAEYMQLFSSLRTRHHFASIFRNKYYDTTIADLQHCSEDVLVALGRFYTKVDQLHWYLTCTQDMPVTVEENIERALREIGPFHDALQLHVRAELSSPESQAG